MTTLQIWHYHQQGQDMIIVPLDDEFGRRAQQEQQRAVLEIQVRARGAGLKGQVVPVWDGGGGRMAFRAPSPWHPFFKSLDLRTVAANVNRQLSW